MCVFFLKKKIFQHICQKKRKHRTYYFFFLIFFLLNVLCFLVLGFNHQSSVLMSYHAYGSLSDDGGDDPITCDLFPSDDFDDVGGLMFKSKYDVLSLNADSFLTIAESVDDGNILGAEQLAPLSQMTFDNSSNNVLSELKIPSDAQEQQQHTQHCDASDNSTSQMRRSLIHMQINSPASSEPQLSDRARTLQHKSDVYNSFLPILPFLVQRRMLSNNNFLFADLAMFVDACRPLLLRSFQSLSHCDSQSAASMYTWSAMNTMQQKYTFFWQRIAVSLSSNEKQRLIELYYCRKNRQITLVQFVSCDNDVNMSDSSVDVKTLVGRMLELPSDVKVTELSFPVLNGSTDDDKRKPNHAKKQSLLFKTKKRKMKASNDQKRGAMSIENERMIWSIVLHVMVAQSNMSPEQCYFQYFMSTSKPDMQVLLHSVIQSLLYFIADNDAMLAQCLRSPTDVSDPYPCLSQETTQDIKGANVVCAFCDISTVPSETKYRFHQSLLAQINSKSKLALRKQGTSRAGKFKGRQHDKLLCISVNDKLGIQVSFDSLLTNNIFALLVAASQLTCDTELNYSDLVRHLPFVFSDSADALFGNNICIVSPHLQTSNPELMFGPVINLLWPNITSVDQLVNDHLKTFKLVLVIQPLSSVTVDMDCTTHETQLSLVSRFVQDLNLTPNDPHRDLTQWCSVVDQHGEPLGVFVQNTNNDELMMSYFMFDKIQSTLSKVLGRPVGKHNLSLKEQTGQRNGMRHVVYDSSKNDNNSNNNNNNNTSSSKGNVQWSGSRMCGFAVRRIFRNRNIRIRTFPTLRGYVEKECGEHVRVRLQDRKFIILDTTSIMNDWSYPGNSDDQLMSFNELSNKLRDVDLSSTLVVVDDIGKPRVFEIGNIPRDTIPQFKTCRECTMLQQQHSGDVSANYDLMWYAACKALAVASDKLFERELCVADSAKMCNFVFEQDSNNQIKAHNNKSVDALLLQDQPNTSSNFRYAFVGARSLPHLQYFNDNNVVYQTLLRHAMQNMVLAGCVIQPLIAQSTKVFKATFPKLCQCCSNTQFCLKALGAMLLVLDIYADVHSVATSITSLVGKTAESTAFTLPIALRCMHDWTNGTGDVFFRMVLHEHISDNLFCTEGPDHVLIVDHETFTSFTNIQEETRVVYLTHR